MGVEFWIGVGLALLGIGLSVAKIEHRPVGIGLSILGVVVILWAVIFKRQPAVLEPRFLSTPTPTDQQKLDAAIASARDAPAPSGAVVTPTPAPRLSESEMDAIARSLEKRLRSSPDVQQIVGVTPKGFVGPVGRIPPGFTVRWQTAAIEEFGDDRVTVRLPDILINAPGSWGNVFIGNGVVFNRDRLGVVQRYKYGPYKLEVSVLGWDRDFVQVGINITPVLQ